MKMFQYMDEIDSMLRNDEELLRLLHYPSRYTDDDPTIETDDRPNILDMPTPQYLDIVDTVLKVTPSTKDFENDQICRVIYYQSPRRPQGNNYMVARQSVTIDVWTHADWNDVDFRLAKICDRINELFSNVHIAGIGKAIFSRGDEMIMGDTGYIGYSLVYTYGSVSA